MPLEEFYESNPELRAIEDPHTLMMERLKDEERRRLELFITKTRLSEKRATLLQENKQRKQDLEDLDENLRIFIEVSMDDHHDYLLTNSTECRAYQTGISKVLNTKYLHIKLQKVYSVVVSSSFFSSEGSSCLRRSSIVRYNTFPEASRVWTRPAPPRILRTPTSWDRRSGRVGRVLKW